MYFKKDKKIQKKRISSKKIHTKNFGQDVRIDTNLE